MVKKKEQRKRNKFALAFALSLLFLAVLSLNSVYAKTTEINSGFIIGQCIYPTSGSSGVWLGSDSCSFNGEYYCELHHGSVSDEAILHYVQTSKIVTPWDNPVNDLLDDGTKIYGGCTMVSATAPCCPSNFICADASGNPLSGTASIGVIGDICRSREPDEVCANKSQTICETIQCIWDNSSCHDPSEYKQCIDYKTSSACIKDDADVGPHAFDDCASPNSCKCAWISNLCKLNKTVAGKGECYITYGEDSKCDLNTGLQTISWTTEWKGIPAGNLSCVADSKQSYCGGVSAVLSFTTTLTIIISVILIIIFYLVLINAKRKQVKKANKEKSGKKLNKKASKKRAKKKK